MTTTATTIEPLLLNATEAARLCGVGRTLWSEMHAAARVPVPIRFGRRVLWRREELEAWVRAGCPARHRWQETWERSVDFSGHMK